MTDATTPVSMDPVQIILAAYREGLFPMDSLGPDGLSEIGFYEADPRAVIPLDRFRVPRTVSRRLRRAGFETRYDSAFARVVEACGGPRTGGTWLTPRLAVMYALMHDAGYAHSIEIWRNERLVGGLFGVAIGGLFTSESMFHREPDAGNAAIVATHRHLTANGYTLWDIQMASDHTRRFGAVDLTPDAYRTLLRDALDRKVVFNPERPDVP